MNGGNPKSALDAAFGGRPWSLSGVVFGDDDLMDDEGRPLRERRAPTALRQGVPMELAACPYDDERRGQPMNVSALEQLTRLLPAVAANVASFRGTLGRLERPFEEMLATLMDLLAAPAIHLLGTTDPVRRVPAVQAAGYKLAIGYFDALRRLLILEARGHPTEATASAFLEFVREHRALIGAGEVCAGPPHLIAGLARLLLDATRPAIMLDPARVAVARVLATQVRLGIAWELLDEAAERRLLALLHNPETARPRTRIVASLLTERRGALAHRTAPGAAEVCEALPDLPNATWLGPLRTAVEAWEARTAASDGTVKQVADVLAHAEGGIELTDGRVGESLARALGDFLTLHRHFVAAHWHFERLLRSHLGWAVEGEVKLHPSVLPLSRGLALLEVLTGHAVQCRPAAAPEVLLQHHRRAVIVIPAGA